MVNITPKDFGVTEDGDFKATQKDNQIIFDLGWDGGKHKKAFYRAGVIYVGSSNIEVVRRLPKRDCVDALNELVACERKTECDDVSMAVQRWVRALENKPVFKADNFFRLCKSVCIGKNYNAAPVRKVLCGY